MTTTEELRRMLDERGVEWDTFSVGSTEYTHWTNSDDRWCAASIGGPLCLHVNILSATPAQAIAATLGAGTCKADETDVIKCWVKCKDEPNTEHVELIHVMECSACGHTYEYVNGSYEYCPNCGRRIEVDDG